jgi:hypothetical protein
MHGTRKNSISPCFTHSHIGAPLTKTTQPPLSTCRPRSPENNNNAETQNGAARLGAIDNAARGTYRAASGGRQGVFAGVARLTRRAAGIEDHVAKVAGPADKHKHDQPAIQPMQFIALQRRFQSVRSDSNL